MTTIPFDLGNVYQGLAQGQGLLQHDDDRIILEFQVQDALLGVWKTGIKRLEIPIRDLISVEFRQKWFGMSAGIVIQAKRMDIFKDVPTAEAGRLQLNIARKNRDAAIKFVDDLHVEEADGGQVSTGP